MLRTEEERERRQAELRDRQAAAPFERHYTVKELAQLWSLSADTVRRILEREGEDVCKIGLPGKRKTYRVSETAARRIHARLTAGR